MKRRAFKITGWLLALALGGFLVAASGIAPIKASAGHWPITEWFLRFGMHRSFSTHSLGVKVPSNLDDPNLIVKGATHYDFGCRSCHGSPGTRQPRIARQMTPKPAYLPSKLPDWKPAPLFSLIKHGVKFTGMPAWPTQQRDDEVWAMVAFLQALPQLDETGYQRLVNGEPTPTAPIQTLSPTATEQQIPAAINRTCGRCHGTEGLGRDTTVFPKLAGQRSVYMKKTLEAYARGTRHSGIMGPIAAGLSEEIIRELSDYYAQLSRPAPAAQNAASNAEMIALGRTIAQEGIPHARVPACVECHGPRGSRTKDAYPLLAGQPAEYLVLQLELFKEEKRGGSSYAHLMHEVAPHLKPEQMRAVAAYFESLPLSER